jgi:peptide/nickel transport system permease protein
VTSATTPAEARLSLQTAPPSAPARFRGYAGAVLGRPITRAILKAFLTIYVTVTITFFLIRLMPGNPVEYKIDELMQLGLDYDSAAAVASNLFAIDLNAPIHEQYVSFMANVARGDLGNSFLSAGTSVTSIILSVLPWTLFAVGTGLLLSFTIGIGIGLVAAYRRNSAFDHVLSTAGSVVSSVPDYLIALSIILILGVQLRLLPVTQMRGTYTPGIEIGLNPAFIGDVFFHAALPITTFFLGTVGTWILSMRGATLATLEEDYVTAARARGLPDSRITTAYVGRNAILPLITHLAILSGAVVGGAAIIELLFSYQGVGFRLIKAVDQRDYPIMQGIVLATTTAIVVANLVADLLYSKLDPRIGRAGGATGT